MLNFQSLLTFNSAKNKFLSNHPTVQPFIDNLNSREPEPGHTGAQGLYDLHLRIHWKAQGRRAEPSFASRIYGMADEDALDN